MVKRMVRAIVRSVIHTRDNPEDALQVAMKRLGMDRDAAQDAYQMIREALVPVPTEKGVELMAQWQAIALNIETQAQAQRVHGPAFRQRSDGGAGTEMNSILVGCFRIIDCAALGCRVRRRARFFRRMQIQQPRRSISLTSARPSPSVYSYEQARSSLQSFCCSLCWLAAPPLPVGQFQSGRRALLANDPEPALAYFLEASQAKPNYVYHSVHFREGIRTYVGRTQYETKRYVEARQSLERALKVDPNDNWAALPRARAGAKRRSRARYQGDTSAMSGLYDWLEYMNRTRPIEAYWDPLREIRNAIEIMCHEDRATTSPLPSRSSPTPSG